MEQRQLGRSAIRLAPLAFGANVFGWTADRAMSFRLLDGFLDAGFDFIDTADVYSRFHPGNQGGESETIIGEWLAARGNRNRVTIATKCGIEMGPGMKGLSRRYIFTAIEASLRRLRTDHVDLYQAHRDDPETPLEETLGAFADLIAQGKVRVIGASNYSAPRLEAALATSARLGLPRYETLQPLYNLVERTDFESSLEPLCRREQVSVIPYYSLASGFLTGKYRSAADAEGRIRGSRAAKYLTPHGLGVLAALDRVAARTGAKPGQVALAWLIAKPTIAAPIASATNPDQLAELVAAPSVRLSAEDMAELDAASA
jgi:aryl-alcohol dehydrogenase-like predicted oxidoreductase